MWFLYQKPLGHLNQHVAWTLLFNVQVEDICVLYLDNVVPLHEVSFPTLGPNETCVSYSFPSRSRKDGYLYNLGNYKYVLRSSAAAGGSISDNRWAKQGRNQNYLCNQVYSMQHYEIMFVSDNLAPKTKTKQTLGVISCYIQENVLFFRFIHRRDKDKHIIDN